MSGDVTDEEYDFDDEISFEYEDDDDMFEMEDAENENMFSKASTADEKSPSNSNSAGVVGMTSSKDSALFSISNNDNIKRDLYSYNCFTTLQFFQKVLVGQAKDISQILNLSVNQVLYLLLYFNWNSEKLMEKYMDQYDKLLVETGITKFNEDKNQNPNDTLGVLRYQKDDWYCPVCCEDAVTGEKQFSLRCGHSFCEKCYQRYVTGEILKGTLVRCPEYKCPVALQLEDFDTLFHENPNVLRDKMPSKQKKSKQKTNKKKRKLRRFHPVSFGVFVGDHTDSEDSNSSDEDENDNTSNRSEDDRDQGMVENNFYEEDDESDREGFIELVKEQSNILNYSVKVDYIKQIAKKYIEAHKNLHWCPAPDCPALIQVNDYIPSKEELATKITHLPIVSCLQSHTFCLNCNYENHYPVPCSVVERWVQKCSNDSETANWINLNTKQCTKCENPIEKNGGCNHMTCSKCGFEFCWICSGPWKSHGSQYYSCNRFDDAESVQARDKNNNLKKNYKKYLHFFDRFQAHQVSINKDCKVYEKISDKIKSLQKSQGISWMEGQFLKNSISTLVKARSTLQWSYVFSYYLKDNKTNSALIFEENQTSLSNAVEDLSQLFNIRNAQKIIAQRVQFIQKQRFCVSRQLSLISCVEEGLSNGSFAFDVNIDDDNISQVKRKKDKK
ncbi:E3 ubiquitin-protein ligase [Saccharomycopsis crataegensis]|uniref:RBR-type E3 ubiquitin transferase n=1 Tax=Saccharomycopsis crataegensis TaxID=43959 RepID=A0AAV5QEZ5_9ASCO|nr:E3 ubiquitin-protein ligase [Saccharomycopsis crataegensis]